MRARARLPVLAACCWLLATLCFSFDPPGQVPEVPYLPLCSSLPPRLCPFPMLIDGLLSDRLPTLDPQPASAVPQAWSIIARLVTKNRLPAPSTLDSLYWDLHMTR